MWTTLDGVGLEQAHLDAPVGVGQPVTMTDPGPQTGADPQSDPDPDPGPDGRRLRLARLARGLSQEELARAGGVTRQAVAGIETGRFTPSLTVALALAGALGSSVEELFASRPALTPVSVRLPGDELPPGTRVLLATVGSDTVALPLRGDGSMSAGFLPAGGRVVVGGQAASGTPRVAQVHADTTGEATLVIAGCDPALPLLGPLLGRLSPPVRLVWWPAGTAEALRLAAQGLVHVAGVHAETGSGREPARVGGEGFGTEGAHVVTFAAWREGLAVRPQHAGDVADLSDVARRELRLVNREPGAQARTVLDAELTRLGLDPGELIGYAAEAAAHLLVASALANGLGDAGVTTEPAALAYGLAFLPLTEERYDLVIPRRLLGSAPVQGLMRVLGRDDLRRQLAGIAGYEVGGTGEVVG
ncbi:MAG: substrate-binding domain-containing protein [Actinomycetes bacterium]